MFRLPHACFACRTRVSLAVDVFQLPYTCFACRARASLAAGVFHLPQTCFACRIRVSFAARVFRLPHTCFACRTRVSLAVHVFRLPQTCFACRGLFCGVSACGNVPIAAQPRILPSLGVWQCADSGVVSNSDESRRVTKCRLRRSLGFCGVLACDKVSIAGLVLLCF